MSDKQPTRRQFFGIVGRGAGLLAVGGLGLRLVLGRDGEKVWQLDPSVCDGCAKLNGDGGLSACSTECVLKMSAVKAVNDFSRCGYCRICPGYHDVNSPKEKNKGSIHDYDTPMGRVCPYDAIIRRPVGFFDEDDYKNNFYEYVIDESKCTGCGKCVIECAKPGQGNGSLRLEVRHNLCVGCNQCAIAKACPVIMKSDSSFELDQPQWDEQAQGRVDRELAGLAPHRKLEFRVRDAAMIDKIASRFSGQSCKVIGRGKNFIIAQKDGPAEYYGAFYRDDLGNRRPLMTPPPAREPNGDAQSAILLPCGRNPIGRLSDARAFGPADERTGRAQREGHA